MGDCKVIHVGYSGATREAERVIKQAPLRVADYPAVEAEINRYLKLGYHIVNAYFSDGMWFILERESQ